MTVEGADTMSMMRCDRCDRYVDTDYCVEGEFTDKEYICAICIEQHGLRDDDGNFIKEGT